MNNFPAMTEAQRQDLIELCESVLAGHVQYGGDANEEDIYKIALAALNAPPAPVLRVADGWIRCSERMPELDTKVLLLFTQYDNHIEDGFIGDEGDDVGWYHYLYDGDALQSNPTHWMPLPPSPQASNDQ